MQLYSHIMFISTCLFVDASEKSPQCGIDSSAFYCLICVHELTHVSLLYLLKSIIVYHIYFLCQDRGDRPHFFVTLNFLYTLNLQK